MRPTHRTRGADLARRLLPLVLACVSAQGAGGQERAHTPPRQAAIGVLSGASLATVVARDYDLRMTYRRGLTAGVFALVPLSSSLALEPALLYTQKGFYSNWASALTSAQDYVQVPLLLRVQTTRFERLAPFAAAGPALAYLARCQLVTGEGPFRGRQPCAPSAYHRLDVGAIADGGVAIALGGPRLALRTRYEWGLRKIAPEATGRRRTLSYLAALEWPL